ncbi:Uncharacterised protein [Mycobacterium tuberculosis]|nr:Uncharacterised protein [Mycobacterium tuberculosis]CKS18629.1 Uncharacterised protein [Mycobacterium tuberculosis]
MSRLRVTSEPVGTDGRYLVAGVGGVGTVGVPPPVCRCAACASGERRRSTPSSTGRGISSTLTPLRR